jgi:hypothetical protein
VPRRRARGTGRDAGLRCRRRLVPGGGDASFEELPAAAGPSDTLVRLTAQKLSEHLGEQFYVRPVGGELATLA